jgi:hypothetical protein
MTARTAGDTETRRSALGGLKHLRIRRRKNQVRGLPEINRLARGPDVIKVPLFKLAGLK